MEKSIFEGRMSNLEQISISESRRLDGVINELKLAWEEIHLISDWIFNHFGINVTRAKGLPGVPEDEFRQNIHPDRKDYLGNLNVPNKTSLSTNLTDDASKSLKSGSTIINPVSKPKNNAKTGCSSSSISKLPRQSFKSRTKTSRKDSNVHERQISTDVLSSSASPSAISTEILPELRKEANPTICAKATESEPPNFHYNTKLSNVSKLDNSLVDESQTQKEMTLVQSEEAHPETWSSEDIPCVRLGKTDSNINNHTVYKRGRPKKSPEEKVQNRKVRTLMVCDECGKVLQGSGSLKAHKQIHSNTRPFECPICRKTFRMKHHLDFHVLTHDEGGKKWTCRFCSKGFLAHRDLLRHERTHTGEKPFACTYPECTKSFNVKQHLTLHIRTHTGERPYKCSVCEKTFTQANSLRIHRKIHNKGSRSLES